MEEISQRKERKNRLKMLAVFLRLSNKDLYINLEHLSYHKREERNLCNLTAYCDKYTRFTVLVSRGRERNVNARVKLIRR